MGVDEQCGPGRHQQVMLAGPGADQHQVARRQRRASIGEAVRLGQFEQPNDRAVAQGVRRIEFDRAADRGERGDHHTHTVQPGRRVASVEPERRAHQRLGGGGQVAPAHAGLG